MYSSVEVNWLIHTVPKTVTRFVEKNNLSFMAKIIALTNKVNSFAYNADGSDEIEIRSLLNNETLKYTCFFHFLQ